MKVVRNAGAGRLTKIHPEIEPVRPVFSRNRELSLLGEIHEFIRDGLLCISDQRQMSVRRDQQMSARIWIEVENDETCSSTVEHVTRLVGLRIRIRG